MKEIPKLADCWAKTDPVSGNTVLSVKDHCNVVGHVAEALLNILPEKVLESLPQGAQATAAAHDLGKLTPGFQLKAPSWSFYDYLIKEVQHDNLAKNHATIGQAHLQELARINGNKYSGYWFVSTGGHHGSYPAGFKSMYKGRLSEGGLEQIFCDLREELLTSLIKTFGPLPKCSAKGEEQRVHLLTGFTIFADWIGSNSEEEWFPYSLGFEKEAIRERARIVLQKLGFEAKPKTGLSFGQLFNPESPKDFTPRPLQKILLEAADSPGLYIVEAPMGDGKTEAALAAAYKRWTQGDERGLYFALPTQLTSDKIHERIADFLSNALGEGAIQTLVHGNAWLKDDHVRTLQPRFKEDCGSPPENDHNDTEEVMRWYSGSRKGLIAPFGTGTIDQALLSILPAKFAALRYFALAGKVVVIDEVHSYDPYVSALVDRLIQFLLKAGSTVIILSATLTAKRRAGLVAAAGASETSHPTAYPLLTKVATGSPEAEHLYVDQKHPEKKIQLTHKVLDEKNEIEYWREIAEQVEAGANVVVIRNTVALAQETYRIILSQLRSNEETNQTGLLHSRFPRWKRKENEELWTTLLGKDDSRRPKGSLLVSTQILEQSVDIDADLLVTDLAPADLVLQRIGRLHRHVRNRPAGFEQPICHILHPSTDWSGEVKDVKAAITPHHYIYPPLTLWQASTELSKTSEISLPRNIRGVLETCASKVPSPDSSEAIKKFYTDHLEIIRTQKGTADVRGIYNAAAIEDKEGRETRYGIKPAAELILLKEKPVERGDLVEIAFQQGPSIKFRKDEFSFPLAKALQLNAVRIPAYLVRSQLSSSESPMWLKRHLSGAVLAAPSENLTGLQLIPEAESQYQVFNHPTFGISYQRGQASDLPPTHGTTQEDSWF